MKLQKVTWTLLEISAILLAIVFVGYGYIFNAAWLGWTLFAALIILHLFELRTAFKIGRSKDLTDRRIIIKNMLFGFTWWVPLRRGIFNR
jgi:hypothetical protein